MVFCTASPPADAAAKVPSVPVVPKRQSTARRGRVSFELYSMMNKTITLQGDVTTMDFKVDCLVA